MTPTNGTVEILVNMEMGVDSCGPRLTGLVLDEEQTLR